MITFRRAEERGHAQHGWLDSWHTFSFGDFHDPAQMGFGALRVINEDRVSPGEGFPTHSHRDMEIVSYVLEGQLGHRDSMGNGSVIRPGDVQRMSAGRGVSHSEQNASQTEPVHFLQVWLIPSARGLAPGYEQKHFTDEQKRGRLILVASPDGRDGSVTVHQDAQLYAGILGAGESATHTLAQGRNAWVHVARGQVRLGADVLKAGDAAAITGAGGGGGPIALHGIDSGEVLLFDLA